jgi:hypothetical protein
VENFEVTFAKIYPDFTKNLVRDTNGFTPQEIKGMYVYQDEFF